MACRRWRISTHHNRRRALFVAGERADPDTVTHYASALGVPVIDNWWQVSAPPSIAWPGITYAPPSHYSCAHFNRGRHVACVQTETGWPIAGVQLSHVGTKPGESRAELLTCRMCLPRWPNCFTRAACRLVRAATARLRRARDVRRDGSRAATWTARLARDQTAAAAGRDDHPLRKRREARQT